jgi:Glycosyl transferase family 2
LPSDLGPVGRRAFALLCITGASLTSPVTLPPEWPAIRGTCALQATATATALALRNDADQAEHASSLTTSFQYTWPMRIACILTVRDEELLLAANAAYHRYLGITDFFIFLDNAPASTASIAKQIPSCVVFENQTFESLAEFSRDKPELDLNALQREYHRIAGVRLALNANAALQYCRAGGIKWLLHIDPDELVFPRDYGAAEGALGNYLQSVSADVDVIRFQNIESVPQSVAPKSAFSEVYFRTRALLNQTISAGKRTLVCPRTGIAVDAGWFRGHSSGKLAIRCASKAYVTSPHGCGNCAHTMDTDHLLHYFISSYQHFLAKFSNNDCRQFATAERLQKMRPSRVLMSNVANDPKYTHEDKLAFYCQSLLHTDEEMHELAAAHPGAIVKIESVANLFRGSRLELAPGRYAK